MYEHDLEKLLKYSETFKVKWTETRNKIHMYKSYMLNRVAIFSEWMNEVGLMNEWMESVPVKLEGSVHDSGLVENKVIKSSI